MKEFTRDKYNDAPIPFTLVSADDHFTVVDNIGTDAILYLISVNGGPLAFGTGLTQNNGLGFYELTLGSTEQLHENRLVYIPGTPVYDPVYFRINGSHNIEIAGGSQEHYYLLMFSMVSSFDHVSTMDGLSPLVTISRNGSLFTSDVIDVQPIATPTGIKAGFYSVIAPTYPESPPGEFSNECVYILKAEATGADITYDSYQVFRYQVPV